MSVITSGSSVKRSLVFIILLIIMQVLNCTMRDDSVKQRLNPLDPLADPSIKKPQVVSAYMSILPVWTDFSFKDSTGSLQCSLLQAFSYITIDIGEHEDSLVSIQISERVTFELEGFKVNCPYIVKFTGYFRSGEQYSEEFICITPAGKPPLPPTGLNGEGNSFGAQLKWNNVSGAQKYRIIRSARSGFLLELPLQESTSCIDSLPDYDDYIYRVGSVNEYGTAFSNLQVPVSKIASIVFPKNVSASKGRYPDYVLVKWNRVPEASAYRIYRSSSSDGIFVSIALNNDTLFRDVTNKKGLFYYRVASVNDSGYSGQMSDIAAGFITDSLDIPDSVNATRGVIVDRIMVFWKQVEGAASYNIYKSADSSGMFLIAGNVGGNINFYSDSSVTRVLNYYRVSAVDTNGIETEKSVIVAGSIKSKAIPENIAATQGTNLSEIIVTWDPVKDAGKYFIYRAIGNSDTFSLIETTILPVFHDTLESDSVMHYKVNCRVDGIESEYSNVATGWLASKLVPANLTASLGTYSSRIELLWRPVAGAARYIIYRADNYTGPYLPVATVDTNRYDDTTILTDDYYFYKVAAVALNSTIGVLSEYVQGFADVVGRPVEITATTLHPLKVFIRWNAVKDARYYIVFRQSGSNGTALVRDTITDTVYIDSTLTPADVNFYYSVMAGIGTRLGFKSGLVNGTLLQSPLSVTVSRLEDGVYLRWNAVTKVNNYRVYRKLSSDNSYKLIDSTLELFLIDSIPGDGLYYYKVSSCSDSGESTPVSYVTIRTATGPAKLNGTVAGDTVKLSWSPVQGVSSYYVYRSEKSDSGFSTAGITSDTLYRDTGPVRSGEYYYYVRGYLSSGSFYSSRSPVVNVNVKVKPLAPVLTDITPYNGYIRISWTPNTAGELPSAYILYRSTSYSGVYLRVDTISRLYYNDSVSSTSTYYYKVSGLDSTGEGSLSGYLSGYAYSPSAPAGESASWDQYTNGVQYIWKKSSDAVSYIVYRATTSGGTKTALDTINDTLLFDSTVTPSVTGYYSVRYLNSHGLISASSTEISGRRLGPPISVSVLGYTNYIRLSWSASSTSGIYYKIYRSTSAGGPFTLLDSTSSSLYNDTVTSLVYYYYKISSVKNGESQLSTVYSGRLSTPQSPVMVSASMGSALAVHIVWNSVQGAQSYKLYRSTSSSFLNPVFISTVSDTLYLDTVPTDSVYYYKCKTVSIAGESSLSSISKSGYRLSQSPPPIPVSLYVSTNASSYIYMYWSMTSNIPMASQYKIYRSELQNGPFQLIDSTSNASYTDYVPKTYPDNYWYYITSWNAAGESAPSDTVSGYRP